MHRNCTDAAVSSVQNGAMVRHETAGQGLFRPIPAQGGCGSDGLTDQKAWGGGRIPPGALCVETDDQAFVAKIPFVAGAFVVSDREAAGLMV